MQSGQLVIYPQNPWLLSSRRVYRNPPLSLALIDFSILLHSLQLQPVLLMIHLQNHRIYSDYRDDHSRPLSLAPIDFSILLHLLQSGRIRRFL